MKLKLPKLPKLPNLPHLPPLNIEPARKIVAFLIKHKISVIILISVIAFIAVAMWYRGYLLSKMNQTSGNANDNIFYSTKTSNSGPTIAIPTPPNTNSDVLGTHNNSGSYDTALPTPFPTFPILPTLAPMPTINTTTTNTSSASNNTGNANCTTGSGVPNLWYSDVYPNPTITTNTGSVDLIVEIRDCNSNIKNAPVSDKLSISLSSGDSNTLINGNKLPYSNITTQNGETKFTVTSQVVGTVTLVIHDDTSNFTVTNVKNNNPSITFTNNSSGNSTGNPNCTTANGVPNTWFSDVSPTSPISAATGSTVTLSVDIRDCTNTDVSSDNLTLTQTSNDSSLTITPSANVQAQNGQATFNVSSQNAGTDTFTIRDTTSNFTVTDAKTQNPSIIFSGSSTSTPTPTPTSNPTDTPTPTTTQSVTPTPINTPTSTPLNNSL